VHVSTAFNNLDQEEIKEEIYANSKFDPLKLIELLDRLDDVAVKNIEAQ
jgi:fatty acyl-CoA reductase